MTLLKTVNKNCMCNVKFINIISKVNLSILYEYCRSVTISAVIY